MISANIDAPYKSSSLPDISLNVLYFSLPLVIIVGIRAFLVASFLSKTENQENKNPSLLLIQSPLDPSCRKSL